MDDEQQPQDPIETAHRTMQTHHNEHGLCQIDQERHPCTRRRDDLALLVREGHYVLTNTLTGGVS